MQATSNRPPGTVEAKKQWMARDLARWAGLYGLEYRRPDKHPQMTLPVMRALLAWQKSDLFRPMGDALFRAMHVENGDLEDPGTLVRVLGPLGITPDAFTERTQVPAVKDALKANTESAVARGMFGAPTFFLGDTLHFGQDRLWMVAEDLGTDIHTALGDAA
jgi:2-hydroxychromene-2-carboxylate isomerase